MLLPPPHSLQPSGLQPAAARLPVQCHGATPRACPGHLRNGHNGPWLRGVARDRQPGISPQLSYLVLATPQAFRRRRFNAISYSSYWLRKSGIQNHQATQEMVPNAFHEMGPVNFSSPGPWFSVNLQTATMASGQDQPAAGLEGLIRTCCEAPSSAAAAVALKQLHRQCRSSKEAAAAVAGAGGVRAAHQMLSTTGKRF